jgi:hypothetical protein
VHGLYHGTPVAYFLVVLWIVCISKKVQKKPALQVLWGGLFQAKPY